MDQINFEFFFCEHFDLICWWDTDCSLANWNLKSTIGPNLVQWSKHLFANSNTAEVWKSDVRLVWNPDYSLAPSIYKTKFCFVYNGLGLYMFWQQSGWRSEGVVISIDFFWGEYFLLKLRLLQLIWGLYNCRICYFVHLDDRARKTKNKTHKKIQWSRLAARLHDFSFRISDTWDQSCLESGYDNVSEIWTSPDFGP